MFSRFFEIESTRIFILQDANIYKQTCVRKEERVGLVEGLLRSPIDHLAQFHCEIQIREKQQKKGWK